VGERYARHLGPVTSLLPGQYTTETASGRPALSCKACGGIYDVDLATHAIDREGRIVPALACPYVCGSLGFVTLGDIGEDVLR
jgi:hypothetical protein